MMTGVDEVTDANGADSPVNSLSLTAIHAGYERIKASDLVVRTPLWKDCNKRFLHSSSSSSSMLISPNVLRSFRLHLKLENAQITGSFKIRGVVNQMAANGQRLRTTGSAPITMSAGNYGKAFAHCLVGLEGVNPGLVVMPNAAPQERVDLIKGMGCSVKQVIKDM